MKKFPALIALVLSFVMLLIPMGAMAEPTTANVIQIANPVISADGETRSMPGLALQLAMCESADASLVQFIADVLVNNQNANSAMLQIDSAMNIVGLLGGMSNAYSLNMEEASTMAMAGYGEMVEQIEELIYTLETWTLPDEIMTIISEHAATFAITESTATDAAGNELYVTSISGDATNMIIDVMTAIENDELVMSFVQMADPYMTSLGLVEGSGIGNGNGIRFDANVASDASGLYNSIAIDITAYTDNVDSGIIRICFDTDLTDASGIVCSGKLALVETDGTEFATVNFGLTGTETGFVLAADALSDGEGFALAAELVTGDASDSFVLSLAEVSEYTDEPATVTAYFTTQKSDTGCTIDANISATSYGDTTSITLTGASAYIEGGISVNGKLTASDPYSGDTVIALNDLTFDLVNGLVNFDLDITDPYSGTASILLTGNYAVTDTGLIVTGKLDLTDSYGYAMSASLDELSVDAVNGGFKFLVSVADEYSGVSSIELSLTPAVPVEGALYSGVIKAALKDEYTDISASCDVHTFTADVDTDSFYIDPMTAISIMTMDELQMETAENELLTILGNLGETIMNAYPAFFE